MRSVELSTGRTVDIPIRVSPRSKRPKIVVDGRRNAQIVVPPRTPAGVVDRMLVDHREWLERELAKPARPFTLGLQRDDGVWIGGVLRPLPEVARLDSWYRGRAREETLRIVEREADRIGVSYSSIVIRDQRTRWGSCSPRGTLSFNWRLVMALKDTLRYVVVHELCHRLEHDHSAAFWRLVAAQCPTYRDEKAWLDEHGAELLAYTVPAPWPTGGRPLTATAR
jgi:predicted metal-dependent hydrolase